VRDLCNLLPVSQRSKWEIYVNLLPVSQRSKWEIYVNLLPVSQRSKWEIYVILIRFAYKCIWQQTAACRQRYSPLIGLVLWYLMPLSTIFQLYRGSYSPLSICSHLDSHDLCCMCWKENELSVFLDSVNAYCTWTMPLINWLCCCVINKDPSLARDITACLVVSLKVVYILRYHLIGVKYNTVYHLTGFYWIFLILFEKTSIWLLNFKSSYPMC
jgi:hypothetical protein